MFSNALWNEYQHAETDISNLLQDKAIEAFISMTGMIPYDETPMPTNLKESLLDSIELEREDGSSGNPYYDALLQEIEGILDCIKIEDIGDIIMANEDKLLPLIKLEANLVDDDMMDFNCTLMDEEFSVSLPVEYFVDEETFAKEYDNNAEMLQEEIANGLWDVDHYDNTLLYALAEACEEYIEMTKKVNDLINEQ